MCGIAALVSAHRSAKSRAVHAMCQAIAYRGPDGEGYALFAEKDADPVFVEAGPLPTIGSRIALGHRRLAIVGGNVAAQQPMAYGPDGRFWLVYNGEIYNFEALRDELAALGHIFAGKTDSEVLLAAYAQWGRDCLGRFNGMFAFVLYDRRFDRVFAARDRFGVKPLYVRQSSDGTLAFASEIKQFAVLDGWQATLNGQRAYDYLNWGLTDHTTQTFFVGVRQVAPGHFLEFDVGAAEEMPPQTKWYVSSRIVGEESFEAATRTLANLLEDAVRVRLRADVEVGSALSGGLDSSSIVCLIDRLRAASQVAPLHTFSACAPDSAFDEQAYVDAVASVTRTTVHCAYPNAAGLANALARLVWHHDEPFGSTSIFAEWAVFDAAKSAKVKVTLDGHGADELFAGYSSYTGPYLAALLRCGDVPAFVREFAIQHRRNGRGLGTLIALLGDALLPAAFRDTLRRAGGHSHGAPDWLDLSRLAAQPSDPFQEMGAARDLNEMLEIEFSATSLPMQLKWTDRNSMAHGVESRAPFLDYRVVEYARSLPVAFKLENGIAKRVLRAAMKSIVPDKILSRRDKIGFATPEAQWVRRDRPEWFRSMLARAVAASDGILTPAATQYGDAVIDGHRPFNSRVWRMICFGAWMERFDVRRAG